MSVLTPHVQETGTREDLLYRLALCVVAEAARLGRGHNQGSARYCRTLLFKLFPQLSPLSVGENLKLKVRHARTKQSEITISDLQADITGGSS